MNSWTAQKALDYFKNKNICDMESLQDILGDEVVEMKDNEAEALNDKGTEEQLGFILYGKTDGEVDEVLEKIERNYELYYGIDDDEDEDDVEAE